MKVLYHHRTRAEDAQGIHIRELCRAFRQLGHQVTLIGLLASKPKSQSSGGPVKDSGNTLGRIKVPHLLYELVALGYNVPAFFVLTFVALRNRPDFIYERYSLFAASGFLVARLFGVPFILEVNAPLSVELKEHGDLTLRGLAQRMEDWICRRADRTIVVSHAMRRIFESRGVPPERLMVFPNGVDGAQFNPGVDGREVRARWSLDDRFVVGFVGWIRPWHGVDLLIDAAARLAEPVPQLRLLIVGDGPAVPDLQAQARARDLTDRVVFTGAVPSAAIPGYIAAMDVAVQPNVTSYASPIKLFEYLAMGKAIIAPAKPNIEEIVQDGSTALIYATGDVDDLADKIRRLALDEALRQELGRAAHRLVEERGYYWESNAEQVVQAVAMIAASD